MVSKSYVAAPKYSVNPSFSIFSLPKVFKWTPALSLWGGSALFAVVFFADSIPILRKGALVKLPVIGPYYDDSIDPEDTPF